MQSRKRIVVGTLALTLALIAGPSVARAADVARVTTAAAGYDLVSYFEGEKPVRGNGNHVVVHEGVIYLFQNAKNQKTFERDPAKYLPAYGGYCAYGVSVGKKFIGDPDVWAIVDGRLYFNLDTKIQGIWYQDVAGNLAKAEAQWPRIRGIAREAL